MSVNHNYKRGDDEGGIFPIIYVVYICQEGVVWDFGTYSRIDIAKEMINDYSKRNSLHPKRKSDTFHVLEYRLHDPRPVDPMELTDNKNKRI